MRRVDSRQAGQAVAEALAGLVLLLALILTVIGVARLQWQGLAASHVSRERAFAYAHGERMAMSSHVRTVRAIHPANFMGPGGQAAAHVRRDWLLEDRGMVTAWASMQGHSEHTSSQSGIARRTAVLADAGHAAGDSDAQTVLERGRVAWRHAARPGIRTGRRAATLLQRVDQGWGRPAPDFDWLQPWADLVPANRLRGVPMPAIQDTGGHP